MPRQLHHHHARRRLAVQGELEGDGEPRRHVPSGLRPGPRRQRAQGRPRRQRSLREERHQHRRREHLTATITVPDTPCASCTLQLRQLMTGAAQPYYWSCAAIKIVPAGGPVQTTSGDGAGGAGGAGGGGSAGEGGSTATTAGSGGKTESTAAGPAVPPPLEDRRMQCVTDEQRCFLPWRDRPRCGHRASLRARRRMRGSNSP